jgi:hypothetical protein
VGAAQKAATCAERQEEQVLAHLPAVWHICGGGLDELENVLVSSLLMVKAA